MSGVLMMLVTGGQGVTISPAAAEGEASGFGATPIEVTTNTVTASVQGGIGPYTYAWTKVTGSDVIITAPTSATTAFNETEPPGTILSGTYRVTATDITGLTASADCLVTLNFVQLE